MYKHEQYGYLCEKFPLTVGFKKLSIRKSNELEIWLREELGDTYFNYKVEVAVPDAKWDTMNIYQKTWYFFRREEDLVYFKLVWDGNVEEE